MFTVVIAEKELLEGIEEYGSFLKPFLDAMHVAFCPWDPAADTLAGVVPGLEELVERREEWRAVIVADETGLKRKNPFDAVDYEAPRRGDEEELSDYLPRLRKAKFDAYEKAASMPLTRLVTYLCESPSIVQGRNQNARSDLEFEEYLAEAEKKEALRRAILRGERLSVNYPSEIVCLARRTLEQKDYNLKTMWTPHIEQSYSRFYDWNLYFDKMRYLIFDLLPRDHKSYTSDYIRFLYALMLLAAHDTPAGCLNANRVYLLECENDEVALGRLLNCFDASLRMTQDKITSDLREVAAREHERLSDKDAEAIFSSGYVVPVNLSGHFDPRDLYVTSRTLGLSRDCPHEELDVWITGYQSSRTSLLRFLKLPRRAVRKAASDTIRLREISLERADSLNEFQLEDIAERTGDEEIKMAVTATSEIYNTEHYTERLEEEDKAVRAVIATRMTKKATVLLSLTALLSYLAGFLPMLFNNFLTTKSLVGTLIMTGSCLGLLAIVGLCCLGYLRSILKHAITAYNHVMRALEEEVNASMQQFSAYLSHALSVMRGHAVLNYRAEHENPDEIEVRIYKKHMSDLTRIRRELHEVFGAFLPEIPTDDPSATPFPYDFTRPVDFQYPLPFHITQPVSIEFMQAGNMVEIPVNFVKRLGVRREELYD